MAEWARIVNTTTHEFIKDREPNIFRNNKMLALLREKGRISYGHSGDMMDWKPQFYQAALQGIADNDTLTFARINRHETAQLDWRGYAMTDRMTLKEQLMNANEEAVIKYYTDLIPMLYEDAEEKIHDEFWVDGNATGNEKRFHGIESFMSAEVVAGTNYTINQSLSSTASQSAAAADTFGFPYDTYAGLSTQLGNYGGSWSNRWPLLGTGGSHYDGWSPVLGNWKSTTWTGTNTFVSTAGRCLRSVITAARKNKSQKGLLDMFVLAPHLWIDFRNLEDAKEQINVNRGTDSSTLMKLGFGDVVNFDGVDITSEFSIPANTGYGFNVDEMELRMLNKNKRLFDVIGPHLDPASLSHQFAIYCYGNLKFNPRHFAKIYNYA